MKIIKGLVYTDKQYIEILKTRINKAIEYCRLNKEFTPRLADVEDILKGEENESN